MTSKNKRHFFSSLFQLLLSSKMTNSAAEVICGHLSAKTILSGLSPYRSSISSKIIKILCSVDKKTFNSKFSKKFSKDSFMLRYSVQLATDPKKADLLKKQKRQDCDIFCINAFISLEVCLR